MNRESFLLMNVTLAPWQADQWSYSEDWAKGRKQGLEMEFGELVHEIVVHSHLGIELARFRTKKVQR